MGANLDKVTFFKNRILKRIEELHPYMSDIKYRLYRTMISDCNSFDEIREIAELDLQFNLIKYIKDIEYKLEENNTNLHEIEVLTSNTSKSLKLNIISPKKNINISEPSNNETSDIDLSTLGEDMEDEEVLASAANLLMSRLASIPPEELYREQLENYEENELSEEYIDEIDVSDESLYYDGGDEEEENDEDDELDIEEDDTEYSDDDLGVDNDDIEDDDLEFEDINEDELGLNEEDKYDINDIVPDFSNESYDEDDELDFGYNKSDNDDFDINEDELFDDSIEDESDDETEDETDWDSLGDDMFDESDDEEEIEDETDWDSLGDDMFDESEDDDTEEDETDWDSLGDDMFDESDDEESEEEDNDIDFDTLGDDMFDESDDEDEIEDDTSDEETDWDSLGDDMFDESDNDDNIDELDFNDDDEETDNIDELDLDDEDSFDIDESEFEYEEPDDTESFDDFFDTKNVNEVKHDNKRKLAPKTVFVNGTKRGKQTQDMFNMLDSILSGFGKASKKAGQAVKKSTIQGINKINNSSMFNLPE